MPLVALWAGLAAGAVGIRAQQPPEASPTQSAAPDGAPPLAVTAGTPVQILDTSSVNGTRYYVNDHTLIQGPDGAWHLFGIFHPEPFGSDTEFEFVHAIGDLRGLKIAGTAISADKGLGETHIWAPHAVSDRPGHYVMAYQGGGADSDRAQIRLAESSDLVHWSRVGASPIFEDICVARDPMLARLGDQWALYYTRCDSKENRKSGVAYRLSSDLAHWCEPHMALVLYDTPAMFNSGYTESPFVFERGGWYYLTVTSYPIAWNRTQIFRSRSPFSFPPRPVASVNAHAAEWVTDSAGSLYFTHCGAGQNGVWLVPVSGI